jgi:hypothetical protein
MLFNLLQAGITLNCRPKKWPVSWFAINRKAIMQWNSRGSHRIVCCSQVELRIPWRQMSLRGHGRKHYVFQDCITRPFVFVGSSLILSLFFLPASLQWDRGHDPVVGVICQNTVDWTCFVINVSSVWNLRCRFQTT